MKMFDAYKVGIEQIRTCFNNIDWRDPDAYAEFLAQTYFYARHTTRILALAGVRTKMSDYQLHVRFLQHTAEEKGHEKMLLNDLKNMGRSIDEFRCAPQSAALFQSQYYWIEHVDPKALFGFILLLETVSLECGPIIYQPAREAHPKSTTYLKVHIEEDEDHVEQNLKNIETMSGPEIEFITQNLVQTADYYCGLLEEVRRQQGRNRKNQAA